MRQAHIPYQEKLSFLARDEVFWDRLRGGLTQSDLIVFTSLQNKVLPKKPLQVHYWIDKSAGLCDTEITHWAVVSKAVLVENDIQSLRRLMKVNDINKTKQYLSGVGTKAKTLTYSSVVEIKSTEMRASNVDDTYQWAIGNSNVNNKDN